MIVPPINTDTKIIVNVGMQHNVSPVPKEGIQHPPTEHDSLTYLPFKVPVHSSQPAYTVTERRIACVQHRCMVILSKRL